MIGIGHRQDKYTKIKVLGQKSRSYNEKYDSLIAQGLEPQEVASILQKEEYQKRHQGLFIEEPYKVTIILDRLKVVLIKLEVQFIRDTPKHIKIQHKLKLYMDL